MSPSWPPTRRTGPSRVTTPSTGVSARPAAGGRATVTTRTSMASDHAPGIRHTAPLARTDRTARSGIDVRVGHPFDIGAQRSEPWHEVGVPPVDVVDVADDRLPIGDEPRHHPCGARPDVQAGEGGTMQPSRAADQGMVSVHLDVSAHACELPNEGEPRFEDVLRAPAGAARLRQ